MTLRALIAAAFTLLGAAFVASPALAGELAVLDLDGFGLPYGDVQLVTQGIRDAVMEDGTFYPVDEFEISDRLSAGQDDELDEARRKFAEGRRALELGNAGYALQQLSDAIRLHESVGSQIGRRPEMADSHYFTGVSLLMVGRSYEAEKHFLQTEHLYSNYLSTRAPTPSYQVTTAYDRATSGVMSADRPFPTTESLQAILERLNVDALIVGWIDNKDIIKTRMIQHGKVVGEGEHLAISGTPYPGDPVFGEIVTELFSNAEKPRTRTAPPVTTTTNSGGFNEPVFDEPDFGSDLPDWEVDPDEDPYADDVVTEPVEPEERAERGTRLRKNQMGKIKSSGRIRYNNGPITKKWWFWTATGAVVVGGGTTAAILTLNNIEDEPDSGGSAEDSEPSYTVSLETGE